MTLRNGTNHSFAPAGVSISESDLAEVRGDLFYEITTTGDALGFSVHDLCEELDDEQKDNNGRQGGCKRIRQRTAVSSLCVIDG